MEVLQVAFDFVDKPLLFTKGHDNVTKIEIVDGMATVFFKNGTEFTIKENYVISYTKGKPIVENFQGELGTKKGNVQDYHIKNKKKRK